MIIYLKKAHSGGEVGAVANGTTEFQVSSFIIGKVIEEFKLYKNAPEIRVVPENLGLTKAIEWINKNAKSGDYVLEYHLDSAGKESTGTFAFYYGGNESSRIKAERMMEVYKKSTGIPANRKGLVQSDITSRFGRIGIVRDTKSVKKNAFLIEMGYITNANELEIVRKKAARAIVLSIFSLLQIMPEIENEVVERDFTDTEKEALKFVMDTGISNGSNPFGNAKRIEVFVMLYRFYKFLINKGLTK